MGHIRDPLLRQAAACDTSTFLALHFWPKYWRDYTYNNLARLEIICRSKHSPRVNSHQPDHGKRLSPLCGCVCCGRGTVEQENLPSCRRGADYLFQRIRWQSLSASQWLLLVRTYWA